MKITSILFSIGLIISNWSLAQGERKHHHSEAWQAAKEACKDKTKHSQEKKDCMKAQLDKSQSNPPQMPQ
jgi:hypothetical protein